MNSLGTEDAFSCNCLENKIFKFLSVISSVAMMASRALHGIYSLNNFERGPLKKHSCAIILKLVKEKWFERKCEMKD